MFTVRIRDPFGCRGVSCVKLPAAVEFPTDERLLHRLEQSRQALPPNSVKPLWRARASVERVPARNESRATLPPLVRIEELYARSRVALSQR